MKVYKLNGEIANFEYHSQFWDFCSPKGLADFLKDVADGEKCVIEINSPGGSVVSGIEMANMIKNSKAHVIAHVTGIAASMASVIACACDEIEMEEASFMMIHDPWSYAEGNAAEMRKTADLLDQMKAVIMSFYRGKFDRTEDEIAALMSNETWYTGAECVENGLKCKVVKSDVQIAAKIGPHNFAKMPEAAAALYKFQEMDDETKAAVEAAKAAAEKPVESSTGNKSSLVEAYLADPDAERSPEDYKAILAELDAEGFGARYKGASKKINELNDTIKAKDAEIAKLVEDKGAADKSATDATDALKKFEDQIKEAGFKDLGDVLASVSGLKADLEKSGQDLAQAREQLDHLKETRDLLTGGVLTASDELPTLEEGLAKCATPKEKSAFIASGKYRKNQK